MSKEVSTSSEIKFKTCSYPESILLSLMTYFFFDDSHSGGEQETQSWGRRNCSHRIVQFVSHSWCLLHGGFSFLGAMHGEYHIKLNILCVRKLKMINSLTVWAVGFGLHSSRDLILYSEAETFCFVYKELRYFLQGLGFQVA